MRTRRVRLRRLMCCVWCCWLGSVLSFLLLLHLHALLLRARSPGTSLSLMIHLYASDHFFCSSHCGYPRPIRYSPRLYAFTLFVRAIDYCATDRGRWARAAPARSRSVVR